MKMQFPVGRTLLLLGLLGLLISCGNQGESSASEVEAEKVSMETAAGLYKTYCGGCHGVDLDGNSATALVKTTWTYGRTRGLMVRNVKFGIPGTDMAAFEDLLTDDQIRAVVDYVRAQQTVPPSRVVEIPGTIKTQHYELAVESLGEGRLATPWAIEFASQDRALISERDGQLKWMIDGKVDTQAIAGLPITHSATSTGGYMDIELDPQFRDNGWIYLSYSYSRGAPDDKEVATTTKIVRGKIENHQWIAEQTLFEAPDSLWVKKGNRWGCRFLFDEDENLLFTIGDMARDMDSQDLGKVTGKIFRIRKDGSIPSDNPFVDSPEAVKAIFTIGNRNAQGLAIHPKTGDIWASEHGPMGGDELNILQAGANYGWPIITYGKDYSGAIVSSKTQQEGMMQPVHQWTPSIGVCPIAFTNSTSFTAWENNLLVGALTFEELQRHVIEDGKIVGTELLLKEMGRVRDIKFSPDGSLYVVLNKPDLILRLVPISI